MGQEAEMVLWLHNFWLEDNGQDLIEYAVILFFIAIACLAFVYNGSASVHGLWTMEKSNLVSANTTAGGS
jgi:Flp pilus assembly pilin Flp